MSEKNEGVNELLPFSELPLLVGKRVRFVEFSDLPCLDSRYNLNLTSEDTADLWRQVIAVNKNKVPDPEQFLVLL